MELSMKELEIIEDLLRQEIVENYYFNQDVKRMKSERYKLLEELLSKTTLEISKRRKIMKED